MFPVGVDKEKDDKSLAAFLKIVDIMTNIGYGIFAIVAVISIYLFITHELLWDLLRHLTELEITEINMQKLRLLCCYYIFI